MASGTGGQIALNYVTSLYDVTSEATLWTNFVSESIEHTLEELEEGAIQGRRDAPPSYKGIDFGAGDIVLEPNPNAIGHFMAGAFGTVTTSLVTDQGSTGAGVGSTAYTRSADYYWHEFTPRQTSYSERTFLEPYGVMVYKDTGSAFMLNGAIFQGLEFDIQAGNLMGATVNVMGRQMTRIERKAAINSLSDVDVGPGQPFVWDQASIEVSTDTTSANLAANVNFEQLTIGLETPHEGVVLLDGTKFYAEMQPNDFRRVNISGTLSFRNQDEYDAFIAYDSRRLRVTLLNTNARYALGNAAASLDATSFLGYFGMRLHIPSMKYLSWSTPIGGPNRLQTSFTAKAEWDDAEGAMIKAELNNTFSSYANPL